MPLPEGMRVEVVRGRLDEEMEERLIAYWRDQGALAPERGRERLPEVVCVLRDSEGEVSGVNSAFGADIGMIAGLPFWVYRTHLHPRLSPAERVAADAEMVNTAFEALAEGYDPTSEMPVGLCIPVPHPDPLDRPRTGWWPETETVLCGFTPDGTALRVRYFAAAVVE